MDRSLGTDFRFSVRGIAKASIISCCVLLLLLGCNNGQKDPSKPVPNIILITVDTLRSDHMACYGYSRQTTPNIDRLAKEAVLFEDAVTPRAKTTPAYASFFTGLYPYKHGVRNLGQLLHDRLTTLAELLKGNGYATAAFVSSFVMVSNFNGLDQGFDVYNDTMTQKESNRPNYERPAGKTISEAIAWLEGNKGKPIFLFLHLIDPHTPYDPPQEYAFQMSQQENREIYKIPHYQSFGAAEKAKYRDSIDRYDGEIAYADAEIGRLLAFLRKKNLFDDSLILFTADHGESLGEHNYWFDHGAFVYDACARIPLIIKLPKEMMGNVSGKRVKEQVSLLDLLPTIVNLTDTEYSGELDGENLVPLILEGKKKGHSVFLERLSPDETIWGIREREYKLILTQDNESGAFVKTELYCLEEDPFETDNLYEKDGGQSALETMLRDFVQAARSHRRGFAVKRRWLPPKDRKEELEKLDKLDHGTLSDDDIDKLRSLGYIE